MLPSESLASVSEEAPPALVTEVPGQQARAWVKRLADVECPAITARRDQRRESVGADDPIVWAAARGSHVLDTDGNLLVDLAGGFAVALVGHAHPKVVEAVQAQAGRLLHGMGDLFPTREKILLGEALAKRAPGDLQQSLLGLNGSDAVEAAIKTACIATGRHRVLAFHGGYHGMSLGALGVSGYRDSFRSPFRGQIQQELRLPYATCHACPLGLEHPSCALACAHFVEQWLDNDCAGTNDIAALIVEPLQGRGGDVLPPKGWLPAIAESCRKRGILLIADEIYTGCGRTGRFWACDHEAVVPDLLVTGKALGGGLPISACIGSREVMGAWGASQGEAIHTSTFLGHPLACAAAMATLGVIDDEGLVDRAATLGDHLLHGLRARLQGHPRVADIRGRGLMIGVALQQASGEAWAGGGVAAMEGLLRQGWLTAPSGPRGDVLSLSPAATLPLSLADRALDAIEAWVKAQG